MAKYNLESSGARALELFFRACTCPTCLCSIVANDYDLSINKYKEVVYEKVEYESTDVIMGKIEAIESEIQTEFAELKKLLNIK